MMLICLYCGAPAVRQVICKLDFAAAGTGASAKVITETLLRLQCIERTYRNL
jgi:hypothetical protein